MRYIYPILIIIYFKLHRLSLMLELLTVRGSPKIFTVYLNLQVSINLECHRNTIGLPVNCALCKCGI